MLIGRLTVIGFLVVFGVLLARVAQLQVAPGEQLARFIDDRHTARSVPALRGELHDRRGRLLATTRFGYRVFIDPERLTDPADEVIVRLAEAMDKPTDEVGERLARRLAENERRRMLREAGEQDAPPLIRYIPVGGILEDEAVARVRQLRIPGVHLEQRPVREYPGGETVASIVGKVGFEHKGLLGAEFTLDHALRQQDGSIRYVRDARGQPLWIGEDQWRPGLQGQTLHLSIDLRLQQIAAEELIRGIEESDAAGGRLVMLDPRTGEVLAMLDIVRHVPDAVPFEWEDPEADPEDRPARRGRQRYITITQDPGRAVHPALGRNRCVEDVYEPGSTFKPFIWAGVTELGRATTDEEFDTEGGRWRTSYGRRIEDVTKRLRMTWAEVLINSSNIGMVKASERLEPEELRQVITRFGFGRRTGINLPGEAVGLVTPMSRWNRFTHTSVAFGNEVAVTPVQMARAFSAFARTGDLAGTLPDIGLRAIGPGDASQQVLHRVVAPDVADLTRETLKGVTDNMERRMAQRDPSERHWRYEIFGKSGTAEIPLGAPPEGKRRPRGMRGYFDRQYNSSFVAAGPVDRPRLVVLAVIDDPGPEAVALRRHYGSATAGPVVRRVLERGLTYLGVPPCNESDGDGPLAHGGEE